MIEWFARNPVAANLLMIAIIVAGLSSAFRSIPVERFPASDPDKISINTTFRGSTPSTAEEGITLRIEEAIADIEGIKEIVSRSSEGISNITVEILNGYQPRNVLDDIKTRVDALNTLPSIAERPVIALLENTDRIMQIAVKGEVSNSTLREIADDFRLGLLTQNGITKVELANVPHHEMSIEVAPPTLQRYQLSLRQIGQAIRNGASDVSGGNIQTKDGNVLIRSNAQAYTAPEFARIPVLGNRQGKPVYLGEIANIIDGFEQTALINRLDNEPAIMLNVFRVGAQSALQVSRTSKDYITEFSANLPSKVSIDYWLDSAEYLTTRINAVLNSAFYGGILVVLLLSIFLRPAVAFWVFLGIPVSFMGAFLFMPLVGGSFNILSLFAFILVIGIVVDDAIVTGENIYRKIRQGDDPLEAAVLGTQQIAVPVTFGILTTIAAFIPLNYLGNTPFSFVASQMPMIVIPVLLMSLVESKLILPSHLSHLKRRPANQTMGWLGRTQQKISQGLEHFVHHRYRPFIQQVVVNKAITLTLVLAVCSVLLIAISTGHIRFSPFPNVAGDTVRISLVMPETTGFDTTAQHINDIVKHAEQLKQKYSVDGTSVITKTLATVGGNGRVLRPNVGQVQLALEIAEKRVIDVETPQIAREMRELIGLIAGAQSVSVNASAFRRGAPIDIQLSGASPRRMYQMVVQIKQRLRRYPGVFDVQDNYSGGKEELSIKLKPRAYALGLQLSEVATQVRHAVFGFEAQRIQRGHDELRVMVRFPFAARSSIEDLQNLPIRVSDNAGSNSDLDNGLNNDSNNGLDNSLDSAANRLVKLSDVAHISSIESPSNLYRIDRTSLINVTADIDQEQTSSALVLADLEQDLRDLREDFPAINYHFDGELEDTRQTNALLQLGVIAVLIAIYILLAVPLRSYGQPLVVMSVIPFSMLGAVLGHVITLQDLSMHSVFGMLALLGVVVNDSLVLIDYTNQLRSKGMAIQEAVINAACTRFRPVLLTSITTFAGLFPILLDGSQQAKWLKPMATSLGCGILFATLITLIIVPVNYLLAHRAKHAWLAYWHKTDNPQLTKTAD